MKPIESGLRRESDIRGDRDECAADALALARLLSYAAEEATRLDAPATEMLIWNCLRSLRRETQMECELVFRVRT